MVLVRLCSKRENNMYCVKMTRKIHIKQKTTSVFECLLIILIIIHLFDELDRIFDRFIAIALSIFTMFVQMFLCLILYISGWNPKYFWFGNLWFEFTRFLGWFQNHINYTTTNKIRLFLICYLRLILVQWRFITQLSSVYVGT